MCGSFFSENTGYYFFSSLLQANASILTITGIFSSYNIQSLQSQADSARQRIIDEQRGFQPTLADFENWIEDEDKYKTELDDFFATKTNDSKYRYWLDKSRAIKQLKKTVIYPIQLLAYGIGLNLVGLLLSNYIHCNGFLIELLVLSAIALYEFFILLLILKLSKQYLR